PYCSTVCTTVTANRPVCANLKTDPNNCNACGTVCPQGQSCVGGSCQCATGESYCSGANAGCYDFNRDSNHCGSCGNACPAGSVCNGSGVCAQSCPGTMTKCGAGTAGSPYYCADINTDTANCGSCGNVCGAGSACVAGKCVSPCAKTQCCPAGTKVCQGPTGQFCGSIAACAGPGPSPTCIDTASDPSNCGGCG